MSEAIHVVATLEVADGKAEETEEVLQSMLGPTRAEDGCVRYELFRDRKEPSRFVFVEQWRDGEALEKHGQSAHIAEAGGRLRGLLAGRPSIRRLEKVG